MEREKLLKSIKEQVELMIHTLKFNEVHIDSYTNSRGKIRCKGKIRVHDMEYNFTDLSFYEIDNIFQGIFIGYAFAVEQLDYDIKK